MEFDREQIEKALPGYRLQDQIGSGSCGRVYLLTQLSTARKVALKKINCFGMCQYQRKNALNQVRILGSLQHDRIIKMESCLIDSEQQYVYIIMEFADGGDLTHILHNYQKKKKRIPEAVIWRILAQAAEGLSYLHTNQIIHRDIKPANIFKSGLSYKLGDLNVSKIMKNNTVAKTQIGSPYYTAPEVWQTESYDQKCDIWSLGLVIYQLCCQRLPFEAGGIHQLVKKLKSLKIGKIPTGYSFILEQVIHKMLQKDPKKRMSADQVLQFCQKYGKKKEDRSLQKSSKEILMDTIQFPEGQQKWINLVPLPPKILSQKQSNRSRQKSRDGSKDKQKDTASVLQNHSGIRILQNRSCVVPNPKMPRPHSRRMSIEKQQQNRISQTERERENSASKQNMQKRKIRIRLPSITKRNSSSVQDDGKSNSGNKNDQQDNPPSKRSILRSISSARRKKNLFGQALRQAKKKSQKQITQS